MADEEYLLTTVDNPYSPFDEFDEWRVFDSSHGHHTLEFLARIAQISPELPDNLEEMVISQAIDEIVSENVSGMWKKVKRSDYGSIGGGP